jgi:hypothetical protein
MLDQCQCSPGTTTDGGFGLRFDCHPSTCVDAAPVVDAGLVVDAGAHDALGAEAAADGGDATTTDTGSALAGDATADAPSPDDANDVFSPADSASF